MPRWLRDYELDVRWYYDDARGDMGERAQSYEPQIGGNAPGSKVITARQRIACERYTRIKGTLDGLCADEKRALWYSYGPFTPPPRWRLRFGLVANLVRWVPCVRGKSKDAEWLINAALKRGDAAWLDTVEREAKALLRAAQLAYAEGVRG